MGTPFITKRQKSVLVSLKNGGKIFSVLDEEGWEHELVDADGNVSHINKPTLQSLKSKGWIKDYPDTPAIDVITWEITPEGIEFTNSDKFKNWWKRVDDNQTTPNHYRYKPLSS
jgi:hypothetical protein